MFDGGLQPLVHALGVYNLPQLVSIKEIGTFIDSGAMQIGFHLAQSKMSVIISILIAWLIIRITVNSVMGTS